ncbi:PAS domain S-box protein [Halovenus sp. WSH3]|uniref:histidine kinase n=1 Tax=Halovenus carboxidivorans TaxID=2692199 RepID=A0A6B0TFK5_9EURY|nr:histidine kinase N-terminal 7TM domain-containing protein [Halovenus carboxidivorans]MXR51969.1 PAS domain S-box protein [Halovenus carboxidivorans]
MIDSLYFPLVFLAAVVGLCIAAVAVAYRARAGAKPLAAFATAASLWTVVEGLKIAQAGIETMELWMGVALTVSAVLPPAWLVFVLEYTGNDRRVPARLFPALLVEPAAFGWLVWTNGDHRLVWSGVERVSYGTFEALDAAFGLAFWGHQVYSYLLLAVGAAVLVRMVLRSNQLYRWQGTVLLVGVTVPLTLNALYSFGLVPPGIDPSGVGYVLAALVLAVAVFEAELEGVAPATRELGREAALTELEDAVLILSDDGRLVDANPAGERLLGTTVEEGLGRDISALAPTLGALLDEQGQAQIDLERDGKRRYYDVRVSALTRGYGAVSGHVLSLRDITERRQREQRLDVLNRLLRHNIRNELNLVRGKIELAGTTIESQDAHDHLDDAIAAVDGIVARSNKLGRLSRMLDTDQRKRIDIAAELRGEDEAGNLDFEGGTVDLDLPESLVVSGGNAVVAAFEELLSNGIEHNDSPNPRVELRVDDETTESHAVIEVSDNGPGIEPQEFETIRSGEETALRHSSGVGLWFVNWVVEAAGGTVSFRNDEGCTVRVRLPRETE